MNKDILCRPFPPELIRQRPGQNGKTLSYVETHAVIARLNEGCDAWSFEVLEHSVYDHEVVVLGRLTADGVVKVAFGGSSITQDQTGRVISLADDLKSAGSDALKKAATLLGVGLELYGAGQAVQPTPHHQQQSHQPPHQHQRSRAPESADRLTSRQLAAIQSAARRHNVSSDGLRTLVSEISGKDAAQFMTRREASALLDRFGAMNGSNGTHA